MSVHVNAPACKRFASACPSRNTARGRESAYERPIVNGKLMIDTNLADNPFAAMALQTDQAVFGRSLSSEALDALAHAAASTP